MPTSYSVFFSIAKRVDLTGRTFVDYGCGAGRIICCAGRPSARKVIGLELSRSMVQKAAANVAIAKPRLACKDIEIVCGNAAE
ncbi:MAG: methyltransferase domain-containing protein [Steroidobacteraceae bacterium]